MEDRYLFKEKRLDNGEWVEGFLMDENYINTPFNDNEVGGRFDDPVEIDESTLCQCTGLRDKNGNLIWENDICDRKEIYPEIVKYHEGDWTLDYSYASGNGKGFNFCNLGFYVYERKCVEVIGNVFDNSELLEALA